MLWAKATDLQTTNATECRGKDEIISEPGWDHLSATNNFVLSSLLLQICPISHSDCDAHHLEATPEAIHEYYDVVMCNAVQCHGISAITSQQMKPLG